MSEQPSSAVQLAVLLDPVRAAELKRQRQAELARALCGPSQPEADLDDVADELADRIVTRLLAKIDEQA
jgi:hypothetical protein